MIKQLILKGYCIKCLGCCRFREADSCWSPRLLKEELVILSRRKSCKKALDSGGSISLVPGNAGENNFFCSFLEQRSNRCRIYSLRPLECRIYPFLIKRKGKELFLAADLNCPFAEAKCKSPEFNKYAVYLKKLLENPSYQVLLRNNTHIAQAYEGTLDLGLLKTAL